MGFTEFTESPDTRKVFVSSSEGDDANSGLSETAPKKTIAAGRDLMRNGFPDWLLLKRGDIWTGESFGTWTKSGRSASERMLLSSYGDDPDRPVVITGTQPGFQQVSTEVRHVALVGIHFEPLLTADTTNIPSGVRMIGPFHDILIEDCFISSYWNNINVTQFPTGTPISALSIRRCVLVDSINVNMYIDGAEGTLVEDCVIDVSGLAPSTRIHNVYIQKSTRNLIFRNNISTRAASHGIQARTGGVVEDNFFARNAIGLTYGDVEGLEPEPGGISGRVSRNVFLEGTDIGAETRGIGMTIGNINADGAIIEDNIFLHDISAATFGRAIFIRGANGIGIDNLLVRNNIAYNWRGALRLTGNIGGQIRNAVIRDNVFQSHRDVGPLIGVEQTLDGGTAVIFSGNTYFSNLGQNAWFRTSNINRTFDQWIEESGETDAKFEEVPYADPERNLATYHESLGKPASFEAFMAEARLQSRSNWRDEYTAKAINDYIRAGFQRLAIRRLFGGGVAEVETEHTFAVDAVGFRPLTYQWSKDNQPIEGATEAAYFIPFLEFSHSGDYAVDVSDGENTVRGGPLRLTVVEQLPALSPFMLKVLVGVCLLKGVLKLRSPRA